MSAGGLWTAVQHRVRSVAIFLTLSFWIFGLIAGACVRRGVWGRARAAAVQGLVQHVAAAFEYPALHPSLPRLFLPYSKPVVDCGPGFDAASHCIRVDIDQGGRGWGPQPGVSLPCTLPLVAAAAVLVPHPRRTTRPPSLHPRGCPPSPATACAAGGAAALTPAQPSQTLPPLFDGRRRRLLPRQSRVGGKGIRLRRGSFCVGGAHRWVGQVGGGGARVVCGGVVPGARVARAGQAVAARLGALCTRTHSPPNCPPPCLLPSPQVMSPARCCPTAAALPVKPCCHGRRVLCFDCAARPPALPAGYEPHSVLPQGICIFSQFAVDGVPPGLKNTRILVSSSGARATLPLQHVAAAAACPATAVCPVVLPCCAATAGAQVRRAPAFEATVCHIDEPHTSSLCRRMLPACIASTAAPRKLAQPLWRSL